MKPVRLSREADVEAIEAAVWYEGRRAGLGLEFQDELDRVIALIGTRPKSFARLRDAPPDLEIRRALMPRFPYLVIFIELPDELRILAVAHGKRRPGYWLDRVQM